MRIKGVYVVLTYPSINPVAFHLGPIQVHWYGLMYLLGFVFAWSLGRKRAKDSDGAWTLQQIDDVIFYGALGVVLGGRLGYMLFYNFSTLVHDPVTLFYVWDGGMSFHGGFLGVLFAMYLFARRYHKSLWDVTDFIAPLVPIGLGAGRLGNFINDELWGRVTHVPWAMVFPSGGPLPRHPSQLYEFLLEGVLLFIILWLYSAKPRPRFAVSTWFVLFYGIFRFFVEFFRQPDWQMGYVAFGWMTQGQLLCVPMICLGVISLCVLHARQKR